MDDTTDRLPWEVNVTAVPLSPAFSCGGEDFQAHGVKVSGSILRFLLSRPTSGGYALLVLEGIYLWKGHGDVMGNGFAWTVLACAIGFLVWGYAVGSRVTRISELEHTLEVGQRREKDQKSASGTLWHMETFYQVKLRCIFRKGKRQ